MMKNIIQEIKTEKESLNRNNFKRIDEKIKKINEEKIDFKKSFYGTPKELKNSKFNKYILLIFVLVLIIGFLFVFSFYFSYAKVIITPKKHDIVLEKEVFKAEKKEKSEIPFEIIIISDKTEKDVIFTESGEVSEKAHGVVTFFNEYSTTAQNLLISTKIADNNGLIYLTNKAITIPGFTLSKDKKIIPGSISVEVIAQNPGEKYNGDPRDFSIVNFKGTPKYTKIYARSKGPMLGGITGQVYSLGPKQLGEINNQANSTFRLNMIKKMEAQIPDDYLLYPNATNFLFTLDNISNSKTPEGKVEINGTLSAVIFKKLELSKSIINKKVFDLKDNELLEIEIPKLELYEFNFINSQQNITKDLNEFSFTLSGKDTLIWHPNLEQIKNDLIGLNKKDINQVFEKYKGIDNANLIVHPIWNKNITKNASRIKILIEQN